MRFLKAIPLLFSAAIMGGVVQANQLTILHINDHHSHLRADGRMSLNIGGNKTRVRSGGFPAIVSTFDKLSAGRSNVLKLHAGDAITGDLYYTLFKGEADAALMNEVCFDAFALGNHEFDDGDLGLVNFLDFLNEGECQTPTLAANVVPKVGLSPLTKNSTTDYVQPFIVVNKGGMRVGIIGIDIANKTKNSSSPDESTIFLDETDTAQKYIDELASKGVNHIILLTHYQYQNDLKMAKRLRGVDAIIGGDSHTRMSKGVAFGADSGTVALALATGEVTMPIPETVKVTFKGAMAEHMDFRDIVHATQIQMLKQCGDNVFQGRIIEVHLGTLLADQAFTFTDWTAEMKAKASICISEDATMIESLKIAADRIQTMIDKGMDNNTSMLKGLIAIANRRIAEITSGEKPALKPDENAKYYEEVIIDLDDVNEPMIADPDVNNIDISKRYTHDTIRPISYYNAEKLVDLGFVGSCMVHKGDIKIVAQMLRNLEENAGVVEFKAPLVVAAPTYNIIDELKAEGDWSILQKYSGFEFDDNAPKNAARKTYDNILYLERPGCNLCMGNQEKAAKGDTVLATSTRLFQGRVVEDSDEKKGESLLASTPVVVLSAILGRTPNIEEYKEAVKGIDLTKFSPPLAKAGKSLSTHF